MADRSTLHDTQYRPVSTTETAANDALSTRAARDMAMSINNAFGRACAPRLVDCWPSATLVRQFYDSSNDTDEHVLVPSYPAIYVGHYGHYTHASWGFVGHIGVSSNDCTLRLYSSEQRYRGALTVTDTTREMFGNYQYDELVADTVAGAGGVDVKSSGDGGLLIVPNREGYTYFTLTCTFDAASANNDVVLLQLSITLGRVLLDWAT